MTASTCRRTVAEIDLEACAANVSALRGRVAGDIWPVVKADAYGHGAVAVARRLARERIAGFCVATASEGAELRQAGIGQPLLVMAGLFDDGEPRSFRLAVEFGLACGVQDASTAARLAQTSREMGIGPVAVHVKIDSGMGRLGVHPPRAVALARAIEDERSLSLDGVFSNLSSADSPEEDDPRHAYTRWQVDRFREVCAALASEGLLPPHRTLANSAAIMHHRDAWDPPEITGVRPGLAVYGASLTPGRDPLQLRPAMSLVTAIGSVRALAEGAVVGYGVDVRTRRASRVAVLPLGYHDGLPRAVAEHGQVWVRGRRAPIIGKISMDITLVDVTDVPDARPGDRVVVFGPGAGQQTDRREASYAASLTTAMAAMESADAPGADRADAGAPITVEETARWAGTIPHEILCRIGSRVPRRRAGPAQ